MFINLTYKSGGRLVLNFDRVRSFGPIAGIEPGCWIDFTEINSDVIHVKESFQHIQEQLWIGKQDSIKAPALQAWILENECEYRGVPFHTFSDRNGGWGYGLGITLGTPPQLCIEKLVCGFASEEDAIAEAENDIIEDLKEKAAEVIEE